MRVDRPVDLVYSTAVRLVPNADQARDVVQLVFCHLARHARGTPSHLFLEGPAPGVDFLVDHLVVQTVK